MSQLKIISQRRPQPSLYFGPPERGFLDWETLLWRFAAQRSYWLQTVFSADGAQPHSMPVWGIWQDSALRFSTYPHSRKAKNLRATPRANVHCGDTEAVLVLECNAREITDDAALQAFADEYNPKYKWDFTIDQVRGGVFALTPHTAFAWADGEGSGFQDTATRWQFELTDP